MLSPIQLSFNSGEVSPSVAVRTDLDKYKSSLKTCRNFIVHAQGGASNRCGFEYISSTKYATFSSASVAQEFIFSQTQVYVFELGHLYIRFYRNGAQIMVSGSPYEISTTYDQADLQDLRFESSADVTYITHPNYKTKTLTRYAETDWRLEDYAADDGPFMPENVDESASLSVSAVSGTNVTLSLSAVTTIDTNIKLLMHMDDASLIDSSSFYKTTTLNGSVARSSVVSKFGGYSALFNGTTSYITLADSADWNFATSDFTIEFWAYFNSVAASQTFISQDSGTGADYFTLSYLSTGYLQFVVRSASSYLTIFSCPFTPMTGTQYSIALVRSGSVWYLFVNGVSQTLNLDAGSYAITMPNYSGLLNIGRQSFDATKYFNGYMDELKITKGVAEYTADYTVSTYAFSTVSVSALTDFSFNPLHVGALFKLRHYIEGQTISSALSSATSTSSIPCFTTWRLITHGTWTAKFDIEKSTDSGTTWTTLRSFSSSADFNANTSGTEDIDTNTVPFLVRINVTSYTSGTLNVDLTTDPYYQNGIVRATVWDSVISMQATVLQNVGSTSNTTSWAEGSWSDYRGYPSECRFFQDRLGFASTPSEPQTDWLSKTSNYTSFVRNSPLLDTDGISVNLPSRQLNEINGLVAFKKLLAFTTSSVWSIGPISGSALTPSSVQQDVEEYSGSNGLNPIVLGTEALYIDTAGEIVKSIGFQLAVDGFIGNDVNVLAKHFFEGYTIKKMAYQRSPNGIVWFLRSDGVLISLTYLKEQNVVAFAKHDTEGTFESICVIPGTYSDELYAIVNRTSGKLLERAKGRKQHDLTGHVFLDSYTHYDNVTTSLSSLDYIANKVVSLIGDGVDLGTMTVSAAGTLPLSATYTSLDVGLSYNSDFETLAINVQTQEGSSAQNQINIGNVTLSLLNTRGGYIGPDSSNLYNALDYEALNRANLVMRDTALGTTENFTGEIRIPLGGKYKPGGSFFLRQSRPLPITITAVSPEISVGGNVS